MKWSVADKQKRREYWYTVPPPDNHSIRAAHNWCKSQLSIGMFYHHYTNTRWWFENENDALLFALRWSGK